jgi:hypothetical protein
VHYEAFQGRRAVLSRHVHGQELRRLQEHRRVKEAQDYIDAIASGDDPNCGPVVIPF